MLELEKLHPALKSNVRLMRGAAGGELTPATPDAGNETKSRKDAIKASSKICSLLNNSRRQGGFFMPRFGGASSYRN
ncbi:hypothetical protein [Serratia marcescens]|uniref:hypothetical protein n=1 Tax=Serratia marcescens TaxID=615 RepID=UPI0027E59216|nr:hypothetical protein [Serratia marcescens]MCW7556556.1 hypothetical protein [Serratia marcescens]MCW7561460.1 hypothetical protein [Serratia marcescens]MCW7567936.1 hypothetical protein [Serratia marcescens]MCW7571464.1 hypothetical protein [Serratia marcescens]MCW7577935.1 hypothetical protein [Serratia marcescens]